MNKYELIYIIDTAVEEAARKELIEKFTKAARRGCTVPLLAKMTPNITDMVPMAAAAKRGGADGIAAINTIRSIIGVNPHTYLSSPAVHGRSAVGGYSGNAVKPIALRFIAELAQAPALRTKKARRHSPGSCGF